MLERCFLQFQSCDRVPKLEQEVEILENRRDSFVIEDEQLIHSYHNAMQQKEQLMSDVRDVVNHPTYCLPYLQAGRLVKVTLRSDRGNLSYGWGCVINFSKRVVKSKDLNVVSDAPTYIVDILLECLPGSERLPSIPGQPSENHVIVVELKNIDELSSVRIFVPKDIKSPDARQQVSKVI